jgi:DNA-binding HxlR family transcriptional regulator
MLPVRMSDKWAPLVLRCLSEQPCRFSELRIPLPQTSAKELARSLRNLQRDGFIRRVSVGRAVSYELTDLGRSLLDMLNTVYAWTTDHWDELLDARDPDNYPST